MQDSGSFFNVCKEYFSNTAMLPLFVVAVVLLLKKWNVEKKYVCFIAIVVGVFGVFNGVSYSVINKLGEGDTYYRFFWICPVALLVAGVLSELLMGIRREQRYSLLLMFVVLVFAFSSRPLTNWINIPENVYQVDDEVIEVADAVMELTGGDYTTVIGNNNLRNELRQYNAKIGFTETEATGLSYILRGVNSNYLGIYLMQFLHANNSEFIVLEKDKLSVCNLIETAGLDCIAETENYFLYKMEYARIGEDLDYLIDIWKRVECPVNMEYIAIEGIDNVSEFVYIADFGTIENETMYQDVINEINNLEPSCVIVNDKLSKNAGWYSDEKNSLDELTVPYYCNNAELQVIEQDGYKICLIDNTSGISSEILGAFENEIKNSVPIVLVLSKEISSEDEIYPLVTAEDSMVVGVLTICKNVYSKSILEDRVVQFATLVDENTMFNIVRVKGKENALR